MSATAKIFQSYQHTRSNLSRLDSTQIWKKPCWFAQEPCKNSSSNLNTDTQTQKHFSFLWPCIVSKLWSERENQQDATVRCLLSTSVSTCFGHHYGHLQENKTCVTACGVLRWFCWMWLVVVVVFSVTSRTLSANCHRRHVLYLFVSISELQDRISGLWNATLCCKKLLLVSTHLQLLKYS